jgi:hypothetical protein
MKGNDNHMLRSGARLNATEARNLPKPTKVAHGKKNKIANSLHELLKWIKDLNPWLHTEQRMVLEKQPELKDTGSSFLQNGTEIQQRDKL